ncbi:MAG: phosphoribosylformimino-5-aminoimidazole carboxamide ribotide isomerase [Roseburia sp.]|nr:phosphoribosylformimino-5-aminoimidazole carboxamide ribotide isomerase [Roseburia sp.]
MEFRPCIDIHNGKVKQIVGGSLKDGGNKARENFVSEQPAAYYAGLYRQAGIRGGHIILLNGAESEFYEADRKQAFEALREYPGGLQVGGGVTAANAGEYLRAGASHVIVTSYVFQEGRILYERLEELAAIVGKEHLVLDVSCRRCGDAYRVVTNRWQKMTEEKVDEALLEKLSGFCGEFLIHAVDVEGKSEGIEQNLVRMLGQWKGIPVTYAGGVHSYEDIELLKELGNNRLHVTVGSALELFGGPLSWRRVQELCTQKNAAP